MLYGEPTRAPPPFTVGMKRLSPHDGVIFHHPHLCFPGRGIVPENVAPPVLIEIVSACDSPWHADESGAAVLCNHGLPAADLATVHFQYLTLTGGAVMPEQINLGIAAEIPASNDAPWRSMNAAKMGTPQRLWKGSATSFSPARIVVSSARPAWKSCRDVPSGGLLAYEGYTRTNLELGRELIAAGRPSEAIGIPRSALRGPIQGPNLYVTRTEIHEMLAKAFELMGAADSAAVRYRRVTSAWRNSDSRFRARQLSAIRKRALKTREVMTQVIELRIYLASGLRSIASFRSTARS